MVHRCLFLVHRYLNYHSVTRLFVLYSGHHSVNEPFDYLTHIHHSNTGHVRQPNAYCYHYFDTAILETGSNRSCLFLSWLINKSVFIQCFSVQFSWPFSYRVQRPLSFLLFSFFSLQHNAQKLCAIFWKNLNKTGLGLLNF